MDHLKLETSGCTAPKKTLLNGGRILTTTRGFGIVSRKRVLKVRNAFMRTKYLVCRTAIFLNGGRTSKSWVAFRALGRVVQSLIKLTRD